MRNGEAREAAREPGERKREQRAPPGGRSVESCEQRHRHHGQQIFEGQKKMRDAVVDRTESRGHEMRLCGPGPQQKHPADPRQQDPPPHDRACQRKTNPATVTAAPTARRANRPQLHRWTKPMAIPVACRQPVAMTKPTLYVNPLSPAGSSVPCA